MNNYTAKDFEHMVSKKEVEYLNLVTTRLGDDLIVFDVGANKGHYSKVMLDLFGDKLNKVYAFEPVPRFLNIVKDKFIGNEKVEVVPYACSDKEGEETFYEIVSPQNEDAEGLSSLNFRKVYNNFSHNEIAINCMRLDKYISDNGIENVGFMKIDTEGHELSVLTGAIESLKNGVFDFIQMEYGDCIREAGRDLIDIINLLKATEYKIYDFSGGKYVEINESNWESYKNISWDNYLVSKHKISENV